MLGWITLGQWLSMMLCWYPSIKTTDTEMIGWFNAGALIILLAFYDILEKNIK